MRKLLLLGLLYFLSMTPTQAQEHLYLPQEFSVKKVGFGHEKQIRIESKTELLAQLSQNKTTPQFYDLYCPKGHLVARIEHHEFNQVHYFDIYNAQYHLIAMAQESTVNSTPYFTLYDPHSRVQIAHTIMNRLHTYFEILESQSNKKLLKAYTSVKNQGLSWDISIINPQQLHSNHIDTLTLFSILSLQTEL